MTLPYLLALTLALTPSLAGQPGETQIGGLLDGSDAVIDGFTKARDGIDNQSMAPVSSGPRFAYQYVVACSGNTPEGGGLDNICINATEACPDGYWQYWLFRSPASVEPARWEQIGTRCLTAAEAAAAAPEFPGFTQADLQRLPLTAGTPRLQPGNGYALVGVGTNVYADAAPVELDTAVVGFPVRVRATPERYSWTFGDGATLGPTTDAGAPYPDLRLTHTYTSPGAYGITLTTHYSGEYSVAGGAWLPIDGEAQVTSTPVPVEVLAGRNALVDGVVAG